MDTSWFPVELEHGRMLWYRVRRQDTTLEDIATECPERAVAREDALNGISSTSLHKHRSGDQFRPCTWKGGRSNKRRSWYGKDMFSFQAGRNFLSESSNPITIPWSRAAGLKIASVPLSNLCQQLIKRSRPRRNMYPVN